MSGSPYTNLSDENAPLQLASTATAAILFGAGTSTTPIATSSANKNFIGFWTSSTATTGDSRGAYIRHYFSGAGGSGEALRAFGTVNGVAAATGGTVNGAHITLSVSAAAGSVSGEGNALRATLGLGASTNAGGTLAGICIDSDFDTAATVPSGAVCLRVTNSNTKLWDKFLSLPAASNGTIFAAHTTQVMSHSIKCIDAAGSAFYIMCTNSASNRS